MHIKSDHEFLNILKQHISQSLSSFTNCVNMNIFQVWGYWACWRSTSIMNYISQRMNKKVEDIEHQDIVNQIKDIKKGTQFENRFIFSKRQLANGQQSDFVEYNHCPKIQSESDLLKYIEEQKNGIYLEKDMIYRSHKQMKGWIIEILDKREVMPLRTKKAKKPFRDRKYQFFYLYPFDKEFKKNPIFQQIFVHPLEDQAEKQRLQEHQRKFEIWFHTKTSIFRKNYEEICSLNLQKTTEPNKKATFNKQKSKKTYAQTADQINKNAIPNLQMYIDLYNQKMNAKN